MSKRDEIAQRVLGKLMNREAPAEAATPRPRPMNTFIGQAGQQVAQGYAARVEELERERESGLVLLRLDPKTIALTEFANRHALGLDTSDESFKALKDSIRTHGQDTPVRVRPAAAGAAKPYELVEGHRRHAACLALDKETDGGFQILARLDAGGQGREEPRPQDVPRERGTHGPLALRVRPDVPVLARRQRYSSGRASSRRP